MNGTEGNGGNEGRAVCYRIESVDGYTVWQNRFWLGDFVSSIGSAVFVIFDSFYSPRLLGLRGKFAYPFHLSVEPRPPVLRAFGWAVTTYDLSTPNPGNHAYGSLNEYDSISLGNLAESVVKYDLDGNLTEDGTWQYQYDGENRLKGMTNKSNPSYTVTFAYDYLGRRVQKAVADGPSGWTLTRFLWFGWNLAAELSGDGVTPTKAFVYGPDFSDAHGNAGGAGSLLAQISGGVMNYAVPDTLGNIVAYSSDRNIGAAVEYSPFGRVTASYGNATNFPIGYSGHYTDWETGLSYYGLRYYMPKHGRFINRDPSEEAGGANLYAFVGNSPTNGWDVMGLDYFSDEAIEMPVFKFTPDGPDPAEAIANYVQQTLIDQINQANAQVLSGNSGGGSSGGGATSGSGSGNGKGKGDGKAPSKPPCSELRKGLANGTYKPTLTSNSFIPDKEVGFAGIISWAGDGRGFLDSPSDGTLGRTSRIAVSVGYDSNSFSPTPTFQIGQSTRWILGGLLTASNYAHPSSLSGNSIYAGGDVVLGLAYSASNPLAPYVLNPGNDTPNDIRMQATASLDLSTGLLSVTYDRSAFPAAQLFFEGKPVANLPASNLGPVALMAADDRGQINGIAICDPSK